MQSAQVSSRHRLEPLDISSPRPSSAQANMQSHPCYQASLFYDNQRAAGSIDQWKKRMVNDRPTTQVGVRDAKRDYQLENVIWTQSVGFKKKFMYLLSGKSFYFQVKQARRMTLTNTNNITDWEIVLLKKQKSYAVAALGDIKGKVL
jgi:hypothetical protein